MWNLYCAVNTINTQLISYQIQHKSCQRHELIQIEVLLSCFSYFKRQELLVNESCLSINDFDVTQYLIGWFDNILRLLKSKVTISVRVAKFGMSTLFIHTCSSSFTQTHARRLATLARKYSHAPVQTCRFKLWISLKQHSHVVNFELH